MFRSLSFLDRLRCEQTCKDWRDFILTEMAYKTVTIMLLQGMDPDYLKPWVADQTADTLFFVVPVESITANQSFVAWFVRRTSGLKELIVQLPTSGLCRPLCIQLFDHILAELLLQAGTTFHGISGTPMLTESFSICLLWWPLNRHGNVCACAGSKLQNLPRCQSLASSLTSLSTCVTSPLQDLQHVSCLTNMTQLHLSISSPTPQPEVLDQMATQITQVPGLKALQLLGFPHSFANSVSHGLPQLQNLESNGRGPVLDVQHCTQLTSLTVADYNNVSRLRQVHLPARQTCCLKQLSIEIFSKEGAGYTLSHLGGALRLTSLAFVGSYPCNLINVQNISSASSDCSSAGPWPPLLPSLQRLSILVMPCAPPDVWAKYGSLSELELRAYRQPRLRAWFADLAPLRKLTLFSSSLIEFPAALLQLTQLQALDLGLISFPRETVQFVSFPHLSSLDLRLCVDKELACCAFLAAFRESIQVLQAAVLKHVHWPHASFKMAPHKQAWSLRR